MGKNRNPTFKSVATTSLILYAGDGNMTIRKLAMIKRILVRNSLSNSYEQNITFQDSYSVKNKSKYFIVFCNIGNSNSFATISTAGVFCSSHTLTASKFAQQGLGEN